MAIENTVLTANIFGAALMVAGIQLDQVTLQQLCEYLAVLGIVIAPTKLTALLGLIGLVINQYMLERQALAMKPQRIHLKESA